MGSRPLELYIRQFMESHFTDPETLDSCKNPAHLAVVFTHHPVDVLIVVLTFIIIHFIACEICNLAKATGRFLYSVHIAYAFTVIFVLN